MPLLTSRHLQLTRKRKNFKIGDVKIRNGKIYVWDFKGSSDKMGWVNSLWYNRLGAKFLKSKSRSRTRSKSKSHKRSKRRSRS